MGQIVRDERYANTIWCLCNNYDEYLQFAKDLWLFKGLDIFWGSFRKDDEWITDEYVWSNIFDVDLIIGEDEKSGMEWEKAVDPINDEYEIKNKPNEEEYPVILTYNNNNQLLLWTSLNKLRKNHNV